MVFDTDVLVWGIRGHPGAVRAIDEAESRELSAVTYMELLRGARNAKEVRDIRALLRRSGFRMLPVTERISDSAVALMEMLALKTGLGPADALIFATAMVEGLVLCSGNEKHFRDVPGLKSQVFRP
ncbi:MAG: type II toxin-antitoxin system VapC family toxin [Kiritimatiellae bacterium]|nr:type II toxin-antitoxin system VapC family toxin [Kiritimatiellia bacterium]